MTRRRLIGLVTAGLLVLAVFGVLATHALPYRVYVIHTGSMSPTIPSTSAVIVRTGEYRVGQVVSFETVDGVVTHRLTKIGPGGAITTKGDANSTADPYRLTTSAIIGGVVAAPRDLGYWLEFLKNPLGLATVLLGALVLWQIWSLASADDDGEAESEPDESGLDRRKALTPGPRHALERAAHAARSSAPRTGGASTA
ncbi:signal peptidase I [Frondihabitans australicus]|uniref:Signal peptidase I n=1 Tax=Frondihabitans australicus TaxID=386892 RepID=A0A495IBR3_9MICO|nr:signal peptidase I [Frondihabitans australicus]RKR73359.1 signal peptidase I [Frondihabitans australicus]